eukprot:762158-Hanusia_phi.AAC.6
MGYWVGGYEIWGGGHRDPEGWVYKGGNLRADRQWFKKITFEESTMQTLRSCRYGRAQISAAQRVKSASG